jgi:hypothetical protein
MQVSGGYDEEFAVKLWDWRMMKLSYVLKHHTGMCALVVAFHL